MDKIASKLLVDETQSDRLSALYAWTGDQTQVKGERDRTQMQFIQDEKGLKHPVFNE